MYAYIDIFLSGALMQENYTGTCAVIFKELGNHEKSFNVVVDISVKRMIRCLVMCATEAM